MRFLLLNLSVNRRRGVEMSRGLYRRRNDSKTWHFCLKCSMYPREDYVQKPERGFEPDAAEEVCKECLDREDPNTPRKCN